MNVMLACGDRAMSQHGSDHDGLPNPHPSCFSCAGIRPGACTVVPTPDLAGRLASCASYGHPWGRNAGPIYPDDRTRNGGACGPEGCFCVVPSSAALPFFSYGDGLTVGGRCAATGSGPGFDARGFCTYRTRAHARFDPPPGLAEITARYLGRCGRCGRDAPAGARVLWGEVAGARRIFHADPAACPPQHGFAPRADLGQDSFFCGCSGWD